MTSNHKINTRHLLFGFRTLLTLFTVGSLASVSADNFPKPYDSEPRGQPMSAAEAARSFKMPPGFNVNVFASEPDVRQPIAMTFDPRGRLWVAENYTYAEAKVRYDTNLSDRVLIFEDTNHDGHFDKRTAFYDRAKVLTSVEVGLGGVFLLCPPRLLFIPDRNHDDIPDDEPEVLLDGFDVTGGNHHTFANGLRWGPDGWLWGRVGISNTPRIGRPGTPEAERVRMNGGIWRYHPTRRVVEAVCHGTTNPWGNDWNEVGEPFFINTVIGHLWHAIPGAHFKLMYGDDVNPHSYGLIDQHADHYHFDTGAGWTKSRAAADGSSFAAGSDSLGGGHAHTGLMIYQGTNWPDEYRGKLFTINFHGRRINSERLERQGSGYVGKHDRDFLTVGDPWFRGIDLIQGPDGGVFIADWSDTGECHESDGVHRSSGRIYKVSYGKPKPPAFGDLTKLPDKKIIPLLFEKDEWIARHARQVLADRFVETGKTPIVAKELQQAFAKERETPQKLRAMWALDAIGAASSNWLLQQTHDPDEYIRSWAVRLLADRLAADVRRLTLTSSEPALSGQLTKPSQSLLTSAATRFTEIARTDSSPFVRLYLASALQKLPLESRRELALALVRHGEDVGDHNLGLMIWFGIEPLVGAQPLAGVELALASQHRVVRQFIARRLAEDIETKPDGLERLLAAVQNSDDAFTPPAQDILRGMGEALRGWRKAKPPASWAAFANGASSSNDPEITQRVRDLSVVFGDGRALGDVSHILTDRMADPLARRNALRTMLDSKTDNLAPLLKRLLNEEAVRTDAIVGLLELDDPDAPALAVSRYQTAVASDRAQLLAALVTRSSAAAALLQAIADGRIPRADLTPFHARQITSLEDATLTKRLGEVWGSVRTSDAEKRASSARFRQELSAERLKSADLVHGRQLFNLACAACHKLYGEGGNVGPDLTGSGRSQLDYLLENIIDPSAVVSADYRMSIATLKDDRVLNGLLRDQTARTVTIQSQTGLTTIERTEIESLQDSALSVMPEGLLEGLPADDRRDLIGYLMHPQQVPLPQ
jgi:putative membrane-bound dehydrogenase-like protein